MTQIEINEMYKTDKEFKGYVDRYARCRTTVETALKQNIVHRYAEWLRGGKR